MSTTGILATFACKDDKILLQRIDASADSYPAINGVSATNYNGASMHGFEKSYLELDMPLRFTGALLIGKDKIGGLYVNLAVPRPLAFKHLVLIRIKAGSITKIEDLSAKIKQILEERQEKMKVDLSAMYSRITMASLMRDSATAATLKKPKPSAGLSKGDLDALADLEQALGKSIPNTPIAFAPVPLCYRVKGRRVIWITIRGMGLTVISDSIGQLSALAYLELSNNQLKVLPESIGTLQKLERLLLDNNQISTVPESIGELTALKSLTIQENPITSLPESIGNLTSLEKLDLEGTKITQLSEHFKDILYAFTARGCQVNGLDDVL